MHDGRQLFQGPTSEIVPYFNSLGITIPCFKNPADFIMTMVHTPSKARNGLTTQELAESYEKVMRDKI